MNAKSLLLLVVTTSLAGPAAAQDADLARKLGGRHGGASATPIIGH